MIENLRFNYLAGFQIICRFVGRVGEFSFPDVNDDDGSENVLEAMFAVVEGLTDAPEPLEETGTFETHSTEAD